MKQFEYRDYQHRVISNTLKAIEEGHRSILIELPTGAGKTVSGHALAKILNEKHNYRYGWTCMRQILLSQAKQSNEDFFQLRCGEYFSTFTNQIPTNIDVLIEDEAQHSAAATSVSLVSVIKPKVHIALTATPYRTDHMKLCFSKVIKDAGTRQLIDEGYLSPFHQYIFDGKWNPESVSSIYLHDVARWGPTVMYFSTIADCRKCENLLTSSGVRATTVVGGNLAQQEHAISEFLHGKLDVLLNVMVLTEGFDAPFLRTVFVRPGSKGPTVQMVGRALRRHPTKQFAQVVQSSESNHLFSTIASPADRLSFTGNGWLSRQEKYHENLAHQHETIKALLAAPKADIPKFILANRSHFKRGRVFNAQGEVVQNSNNRTVAAETTPPTLPNQSVEVANSSPQGNS